MNVQDLNVSEKRTIGLLTLCDGLQVWTTSKNACFVSNVIPYKTAISRLFRTVVC
jgi:hypothetical protein